VFLFESEFWQSLHYNNIFILALELLLVGGWFFIFWYLWTHFKDGWLNWRQAMFDSLNPHVLLEVSVPKDNDRDIRAIEEVLNQIHAVQRIETWWERWWKGMFNLKTSLEVVSREGNIVFYIRSTYKYKHLVEQAFYAEYPNVQLRELKDEEDFIHLFPDKMPDKEFDMLGSEYILFKPSFYPIKTYKDHFTDDGKYIDPMRHLFEMMGNLREGEYMWYQLVLVPDKEGWGLQYKSEVDKLLGKGGKRKKGKSVIRMFFSELWSLIRLILLVPINLIKELFSQLFGGTGKIIAKQVTEHTYGEVARQLKGVPKETRDQIVCLHEAFLSQFRKKKPGADQSADVTPLMVTNIVKADPHVQVNVPNTTFPSDYLFLSKKNQKAIDAIERKLSQQVFKTSVRMLYFAKKPSFAKFRFWSEMHGFFRHFNDIDHNVWIRSPFTYTAADYFFAGIRKKWRQNALITNAKARDWYAGDELNYLSTEELVSLWHFPNKVDLKADVKTVVQPATAPPPEERGRVGYNTDDLLDLESGAVPDDLPVTEYEPYNYA